MGTAPGGQLFWAPKGVNDPESHQSDEPQVRAERERERREQVGETQPTIRLSTVNCHRNQLSHSPTPAAVGIRPTTKNICLTNTGK